MNLNIKTFSITNRLKLKVSLSNLGSIITICFGKKITRNLYS